MPQPVASGSGGVSEEHSGSSWESVFGEEQRNKELSQMLCQAPVCAGLGMFYMENQ